MLQAINSISGLRIDAEYVKIIQELRTFGIAPTGNKTSDAQKLAQAKAELIQRIKHKEETNDVQELGVQVLSPVDETQYNQKSEMEEQRLGAMNVAELNKLFFGL